MRQILNTLLFIYLFSSGLYAQKSNVVLILIDDLSHYGVSAYGADKVSSNLGYFENVPVATPRIDRLAEQGMLVNNAFAYPLCEASRIALMSGQHNNRNYLKCKSQHASDITFGDTFKKAGYATGIFGKWKQTRGTREIPGTHYIYEFGWDEFTCFDVVGEDQRYINPNLVINGRVVDYKGRTDLDPETGRRWYGPDICNRNALKFIEKNRGNPFFLYYPMLLVHDDHKPTPDTRPKSIFDNFDEVKHNRDGHTGNDHRYFPDMVAYMDKLIGKVVDKLDELGLREKTLIIVMGDNGTKESFTHVFPDGSKYPGRKGGNADNGIHVPLVLSQPGTIPTGGDGEIRRYDGLVNLTDIYPTIAEANNVEIPNKDQIDGISFWPQATGAGGEPRNYIYTWYNANYEYTNEENILKYAFTKDFKRYAPSKNFPEGRFFDLRTDSLERVGDRKAELRWGILRYSGLDVKALDEGQQKAYHKLGEILDRNEITKVEQLKIVASKHQLKQGNAMQVHCEYVPGNATRKNIVWESSDPTIATVDKFGMVKGHKKGRVSISAYSWDDAYPLAANKPITFSKAGIRDEISISIE